MKTTQRIIYLDIIRILACCMIVLMHSPHPNAGISGVILTPISFLTAPGIGLFFMVSGALLLPINESTNKFLKKRLTKVLWPTIFWSLFYLLIKYVYKETTSDDIIHSIISMPFSPQGHGIMWFMYTLIGLYLLAPVISPLLIQSSEIVIRFYLIIWGITLCFPYLNLVLDINNTITGPLYYFSGYIGYFVLGYYLHRYKPSIPAFIIGILFFIPIILLAIFKYYRLPGDFYDLFWYLSLPVAMMSIAWFVTLSKFRTLSNTRTIQILKEISCCCFGIYLIHIFIMRRILWNVDYIAYNYGGIIQIILTAILTFIISFTIIYAISWLPKSHYLIGYSQKR